MASATWTDALGGEKSKPYFHQIMSYVAAEREAGKDVYPPQPSVFNALKLTQLCDVKAVIIGQDPYHEPGQAHGLCFSVPEGIAFPPSLRNIFAELSEEYPGYRVPASGNLEAWAKQGVLLLNNTLTVERAKANSHAGIGWDIFTDAVIAAVNANVSGVVYMLWGSFAQKKCARVDASRNLILKAPHPSPLSAYRGFFGCGHFKRCNEYLRSIGKQEIDWSL